MKIRDFYSDPLTIDDFEVRDGEAWCIIGRNRSGIDLFFSLAAGELPPGSGEVERPDDCGIFSFSSQQALFEEELKNDDTDFMDRLDPGTPARDLITDQDRHRELIRAFDLERVLAQGYRQLSTGQSRKVLLLSQITRGASFLLIQAPYEGLDPGACKELDRALTFCLNQGIRILITVNNPGDIPEWATHIGIMAGGRLVKTGPRPAMMDRFEDWGKDSLFTAKARDLAGEAAGTAINASDTNELIRLESGAAGYQGKPIFKGLDLTVVPGGHTLVYGTNGSGKSTLLQMITGDHPACYQNRLWIFGIRRGTGESIWDLKQRMGLVSPDLHRNYRVPGTALDCVVSGLFDSIGLYTRPDETDITKAMAWLDRISLKDSAQTPFRQLSYADQRLVLIARALIKLPELLILDEPTHGLDTANREAVMDFLAGVAEERLSTILYVSHRQDEFRPFFTCRVNMEDFRA